METNMALPRRGNSEKFKSYYVVWKPFSSAAARIASIMFKSYYVVWKPFFTQAE